MKTKKDVLNVLTIHTCDVPGCGVECHNTCRICGRDVCNVHAVREDDGGDYPPSYCDSCWKVGERWRKQIADQRAKFEAFEEDCEQRWKIQAMDAVRGAQPGQQPGQETR